MRHFYIAHRGSFFTESLIQAIDDKKDSCVLIKNPDIFFEIISTKIPQYIFIGNGYCNYEQGKFFGGKGSYLQIRYE